MTGLRPLAGGASSLTFAASADGRDVVVKVAPPGVEPVLHRDVLRQARMIRALAPTDVPVPEVLFEDAGHPPDVPPLFAMTMLPGSSVEPLFDTVPPAEPKEVMAQRMRNAACTLARLHGVDPDTLGLSGEPVVGPNAEVERWARTLATVDPALVPAWTDLRAALAASLPPPLPPVVVHGDFRLGNLLATGERITAVIDWEIWSLGDPRVDLGWFLINCDAQTYRRPTPYVGATPAPTELLERYGRPVADVAWFAALACFKSAATWSLIVKNNRKRATPDPGLEAMAGAPADLLARATSLLG